MPPVLVLVGPPGAGKSTVGRILGERLGVPFRDTDADVEATAGKAIADVFVEDGEESFRELERRAVRTALEEHDGVLSLGGGAVLADETRRRLAGHRVVFLQVGLADAVTRVGLGASRPVLALNPRAALRSLLEARLPLYREVVGLGSGFEVVTDGRSPEDVADEVVARMAP